MARSRPAKADAWRAARAQSAGGAVRLRPEHRALADGRGLLQQMFPQALYVNSAGVRKGELDPFAVAVMDELGLDISDHKPMTFEELEDWEGLNFDLIITLSPEAHHKALELTRTLAADVEYWPTPGSDRHRRQPRAEAGRLSRGLRRPADAHPQALRQGRRGERVSRNARVTVRSDDTHVDGLRSARLVPGL